MGWDLLTATRSSVSIEKCSCEDGKPGSLDDKGTSRWFICPKIKPQRLIPTSIKAPLKILKLCLLCSATDLKKSWVDLHKWTFAQCAACYLQHCIHINSHLSPVLLVNNHHVSQPLQPPGSCEDSWTCSLGETKTKGLLPGSIALVFASLWLRFLEIEGNVQRCN